MTEGRLRTPARDSPLWPEVHGTVPGCTVHGRTHPAVYHHTGALQFSSKLPKVDGV